MKPNTLKLVFKSHCSDAIKILLDCGDLDFAKNILNHSTPIPIYLSLVKTAGQVITSAVIYSHEFDLHGSYLKIVKSYAYNDVECEILWNSVIEQANKIKAHKIISIDNHESKFAKYIADRKGSLVDINYYITVKPIGGKHTDGLSLELLSHENFNELRRSVLSNAVDINADIPFVLNGMRSVINAPDAKPILIRHHNEPKLLMVHSPSFQANGIMRYELNLLELSKTGDFMSMLTFGMNELERYKQNTVFKISESSPFQKQFLITAEKQILQSIAREDYADIELELSKLPNVSHVPIPKLIGRCR